MGEFRAADTVDLLDLTADVFGQLLGGFLGIVFDFDFDEEICAHSLEVH